MTITLHQFENIDGLQAELIALGDFEASSDPRAWIAASNSLMDACIDAIGYDAFQAYASAGECAADITARALNSSDFVADVDECDCGATIEVGEMLCRFCAAEYRAELSASMD